MELLKKLIHHCYGTVPYYRQLMDEQGIDANGVKALEDIKQFPVLTKKDVLQAGRSIVSTKYPKWLMRTARTGGTTGTPLRISRTLFSIGDEHAFVRRQWDWANIGFADRCAWLVAGRRITSNEQNKNIYAYDPFMKELTLSAFHLSSKNAEVYAEAMQHYQVKAIVGISSAIYFLAKVCMDSGIRVELRSALTTSETITEPMKEVIASAFGCRVFDFYGAAERVCYIHTCEHGFYHIIPEYGLTELIPTDNGENNQFRIIGTGFWNLGMPLIRYDTGDIVVKSGKSCPCGREFPVIESVSGRRIDTIKTLSGKEYGPTFLARVIKGANNILGSCIIQTSLDCIQIEYIPGLNFSDDDLLKFQKHLSAYLPNELKFSLKQVDVLPKSSTGKPKFVISGL
ncbi:MAG: phenylacetate--CoA ligase family protein [Sedimentisphaerales bacterium]|nr:phenylacetate--CoA ligase family protein [Sedimentisphaerales bacterium]